MQLPTIITPLVNKIPKITDIIASAQTLPPTDASEERPVEVKSNIYSLSLLSLDILNSDKPNSVSEAEWDVIIQSNVNHIKWVLSQPWWTSDYDLSCFEQAMTKYQLKE